jgi:hypothetical protein
MLCCVGTCHHVCYMKVNFSVSQICNDGWHGKKKAQNILFCDNLHISGAQQGEIKEHMYSKGHSRLNSVFNTV